MYSKINLDDVSERTRTSDEPTLKALGYELRSRGGSRPQKMRFNHFEYDKGQSIRRHKQQEQEELYFVVDGQARMEVEDEEFRIKEGDVVVVDPGLWRQVTAVKNCEIFVVGAPNVRDDAVFESG